MGCLITCVSLLLSACFTDRSSESTWLVDQHAIQFVAAPAQQRYSQPVWVPGLNAVVVDSEALRVGPASARLQVLAADLTPVASLLVPSDPACPLAAQRFPRALADGRLAYIQQCYGLDQPLDQRSTLMAWDPATNSTTALRPYRVGEDFTAFDFDPAVSTGLIQGRPTPDEQLFWLGANGPVPTAMAMDRAHSLSWSPDGTRIAFWGLPDAHGNVGPDRIGLPGALYIARASPDLTAQPLIQGVTWAGLPAWSPDGRWIAVSLDFAAAWSWAPGLWLINAETGKRYPIATGDLGSVTWLPDGRTLVVTVGASQSIDDPAVRPGLEIIELPNLAALDA
jgi:hypothetical protein